LSSFSCGEPGTALTLSGFACSTSSIRILVAGGLK
jgi:hypothetical protein